MTTCSFTATTPYLEFCRELRPLLPAGLTNKDREKLVGRTWRELSEAGRATYERGLAPLITTGRGGFRKWAPTPPTKLPTPPSAATFLVGRAAAVSVCASVSAERTAKTAPPSPDPEDQPAAKRRAYQENQGGLRQHAHAAPPSPASLPPFRFPAVEQAVTPQGGGGGGGGASSSCESSEGELERGGQGEGGRTEGELDIILQEQLARLRSSWYRETDAYRSLSLSLSLILRREDSEDSAALSRS